MKKKILSLLLTLGLAVGLFLPAVQATLTEPVFPLFEMKVSADQTVGLQPGETVKVSVVGKALPSETDSRSIVSYQFTLDYPKEQLKLEKITTALPGRDCFVSSIETGVVTYNAMTAEGVTLEQDGTVLATAEFTVQPVAAAVDAVVGVKDAEMVRPNDWKGPVDPAEGVTLKLEPVLALTVQDGAASVTVNKGRSGTLVTAVYSGQGQMLDLKVVADVAADPEKAQTVELTGLELTGGALVKAFLLDENSGPICAAAELALPVK